MRASGSPPPRPGFRELVDLSSLKIPFLQGAIEVQRSFLQNRRDTVLNLLKGYIETIKLAKEKPELAIAAISKRMRVPPESNPSRLSAARKCLGRDSLCAPRFCAGDFRSVS